MAFEPFGTTETKQPFSPFGRQKTVTGFSPFGKKKETPGASKVDLTTAEGLRAFAKLNNIELDEEEEKLSILQRLGRGLATLEPVNAFYEAKYEGKSFVKEYLSDIFQEAGSAITGKELRTDTKKTFKDVLVKEGMKDRAGKIDFVDIAGLAGDILTDPGTYFGGTILKGAGKGAKFAGKKVGKVGEFVAPRQTAAIKALYEGGKDAFGKAFVAGYGQSKNLPESVQGYLNIVGDVKTGIGKKFTKMFSNLTKEGQDDLVEGMIKARKAFGLRREELIKGGKSFEDATKMLVKEFDKVAPDSLFKNPETIKFFNKTLLPELQKQKKVVAKIQDKTEDMLMTNYFPFIKKDTVNNFMGAVRVGKEGGLKRFKGILGKDEIITDAAEAYATRAFEIAKDGFTRNELNRWVKSFGKPLDYFKNSDEALKAGYQVVKEKGMYGKQIGYMLENDAKAIKEIFDPSYKVITDIARVTGFDALTGLFKKSVTGLFPSFHSRNFVSGIIQNYEVVGNAALYPTNIALGQKFTKKLLKGDLKGTVDLGGETFKVKSLLKPFQKRFGYSSQYIKDFGWESQKKLIGKPIDKLNLFEQTRKIGNYIETQQKMTAYFALVKKGHSISDALRLAERAGFDYGMLTPFEKNVMRRLIPFYSFTRKNLELQLRTLAKNPERVGNLLKAGRSFGTPQGLGGDGEMKLPDWMRNRITASFGSSAYGLPQVLSGFGTPLEENAELMEKGLMGILSRLNPILKVPLERATGKDFFRERDIKDVYDAKEYSEAPQVVKDWLKIKEKKQKIFKGGKWTGKYKTVYVADPYRLQFARSMFTSRAVGYLHTLFGESELSNKGRIVKSLTGMKPYEIDETIINYFEDRDNARDLIDFYKRLGLLKVFEKPYIPKK